MRKRIALSALGFGLAASFLPVSSASAVCAYTYEVVTGHCDPCPEIANTWNRVNDASGRQLPSMYC